MIMVLFKDYYTLICDEKFYLLSILHNGVIPFFLRCDLAIGGEAVSAESLMMLK